MSPQQLRYEQHLKLRHRQAELSALIAQGEDSLLASEDSRTRRALDKKLTVLRNELHGLQAELSQDCDETFREFQSRQNCESFRLPDGKVLFENGASCLLQAVFGSERISSQQDPPGECFELLRARRAFWQAKLNAELTAYSRAERDYSEVASNAARFPDTCPPLHPAAVECLKAGQARIQRLKEQLTLIDAELAESPEAKAQHAYQQQQAERRYNRNATLQQVLALGDPRN